MAPEILEGAVNLRDCEISLKQIDVYSLGLVLWELSMRCQDFYSPEMLTPVYAAPYEAEIGVHPSFDQMRSLVLQHKARPLFPATWGGGPSAYVIKEICEDCWDPDAEARLTSVCVEERLMEISTMKPRCQYVASSTPLSTNNFIPTTASAVSPQRDQSSHHFIAHVEHTCDTMLLSSPSSENGSRMVPIKNREIFAQQIQPFQGRNLCLERNLVQIHQQEASSDEKSIKKCPLANGNLNINNTSNDDYFNLEYEVLVEELLARNISQSCTSSPAVIQTEILPKRNNNSADAISDRQKSSGWLGVKKLIQRRLMRRSHHDKPIEAHLKMQTSTNKNIRINMIDSHHNRAANEPMKRNNNIQRPRNLNISPIVVNRNQRNNHQQQQQQQAFKTPPNDATNESFAVIREPSSKIVTSKSATLNSNSDDSGDTSQMKRQRSLEVFRDVFGPPKGSMERLRDVHQRIKTPGDVPASVRKVRASKTLSLYDDRMMDSHDFYRDGNSV